MSRAPSIGLKYTNPRTKTSALENPGPGSYKHQESPETSPRRAADGSISPRGVSIGRAQKSIDKLSIEVPGVGTYNQASAHNVSQTSRASYSIGRAGQLEKAYGKQQKNFSPGVGTYNLPMMKTSANIFKIPKA